MMRASWRGGIMISLRLFLIQCLEKFWMSYWWILFNKRMVSWWNNFSILVDWFVLLHMMNLSSVILEVCKLCHTNATNVTFKRLEFFMNYLKMLFSFLFIWENLCTILIGTRKFSFLMNRMYMSFQCVWVSTDFAACFTN